MKLYSLPYDDSSNKYFELWRGALVRAGVDVQPVPKNNILRFLFTNIPTGSYVAIHWSTVWYGSRFRWISIGKLVANGISLLLLKYVRGVRIVWVIHNNYAHEFPFPMIDRIGRFCTAHLAQVIIAQQRTTQAVLAARFPRKHIVYIPHGNYSGAYGPRASDSERDVLRSRLGYAEKDIVLLSLGAIRPYKCVEGIARAVSESKRDELALLVAGKGTEEYCNSLRKLAGRIQIENHFIPNAEIPHYLKSADYAIFMYDESELTSGAILLALSYGLPVITRTIAGAAMVENGMNGHTYTNETDLIELLQKLPELPKPKAETVIASVASFEWDTIATMYVKALTKKSV